MSQAPCAEPCYCYLASHLGWFISRILFGKEGGINDLALASKLIYILGIEALAWQSFRVLDCRSRRNSTSCVPAVVLSPVAYVHVGNAASRDGSMSKM